MRTFKVVVEQHPDGYVAYPLGLKGVVLGEGDTAEQAMSDVQSAIRFHIETFGADAMDDESQVLDAYLLDAELAV